MRFVFISTMAACPWGGSEELWTQTAERLVESGHHVAASVTSWPELSPKVTVLKDQGIDLHVRRPAPSPTLASRLGRRILRTQPVSQRQKDLAWLQEQKPDLVIISQGGTLDGAGWMTLCRQAGLPYIPIVHCSREGWWPSDDESGNVIAGYQAARKALFVSRGNLELWERQLGVSLARAEVIWNPYNVLVDEPPAWPEESGTWKLAGVGRLEPLSKGQDLLFQVLACPQWRERLVEVNLYGQGPGEQNLKRLVERYQLKCVHFRGHVADVKNIWADHHLLVLPSRSEGLPLVLVEAMWCARPAVVTDVGGNAELCIDGETGFVAAAPTASLLEETLERAWNQRAQWRTMGQAGRARADKLIPRDPVGDFCRMLLECGAQKLE